VIYAGVLVVLILAFNALLLFGGLSGGAFMALWALVMGATALHVVLHVRRRRKGARR
jgi:predicted membrane metal-binding protein